MYTTIKKNYLIILLVVSVMSCQKENTTQHNSELNQQIDSYAEHIMSIQDIPGMAIAVIKNDSIIHKSYYGKSSLDSEYAINEKTIFRLYSLSKLMTTVSVFKLIEEGKLSLDDTLSKYFNDLPETWQSIQIRNLLSHSSGLPDVRNLTTELSDNTITDEGFIALLYNDKMDFNTNEEWRYNQTNFLLLKLIIEKISKVSFEDHIMQNQFPDSNSNDVLFSSNPNESIPNRSHYYDYDKKAKAYKMKPEFPGERSHPLNGINITLDAYIKWDEKLDNGTLLSSKTKASMWTPFKFLNSSRAFLNGWDVYDVNGYNSYGFSGGGVSGYRKFIDKNFTIMVLTNGYKYYSVQDNIIDHIAGLIDTSLRDEDLALTEQILGDHFLGNTSLSLEEIYTEVEQGNPNRDLEQPFKSVGYQLFFQLDRPEDAIALFKLNVLKHPDSYDTYGSLGYLYFLTEQYDVARENYVKAYELNPENSYSERTIKKIDDILSAKK